MHIQPDILCRLLAISPYRRSSMRKPRFSRLVASHCGGFGEQVWVKSARSFYPTKVSSHDFGSWAFQTVGSADRGVPREAVPDNRLGEVDQVSAPRVLLGLVV
jgi:hypothetical protein